MQDYLFCRLSFFRCSSGLPHKLCKPVSAATQMCVQPRSSHCKKHPLHVQSVTHLQEFRRRGLNLVGFSFDGDTPLRRAMYDWFRDATDGAPPNSLIQVNHKIMELYAVHPHPGRQMAILCFCDWLHIVFRLRRQMLEPKRHLDIGELLITLTPLRQMARKKEYRLSLTDMDFANKQCFEGQALCKQCFDDCALCSCFVSMLVCKHVMG